MDDWPGWATEQVRVQAPCPAWRQQGEQLCRHLDAALGRWLVAPIEHVGSTAVAGVAAKPILDVQAAVLDLDCAQAIAPVLAPTGWHLVPPALDARPWRRLLVQAQGDRRVAHLHLLVADSARWVHQLAFRDALRADEQLVHRYARLKRSLAARHVDDREAYTAGKQEFIIGVLRDRGDGP